MGISNSVIDITRGRSYCIITSFKNIHESNISDGNSMGIIKCDEKIEENTTLSFGEASLDYILVWNKTIEVNFTIPKGITQGVYEAPRPIEPAFFKVKSYFFKITPGLPMCIKTNTSDLNFDVIVHTYIWINNKPFNPETPLRMRFNLGEFCFDQVWEVFNNLVEEDLYNESYKPLMEFKDTVVLKYIVEVYVKPYSKGDMSINLVIGPPYIQIRL